jgi:NAD(P)-dependent dehydrogenase (short-subunit alcohol dehydrogenase family)
MSAVDAFQYQGKHVLVVGGATGMGAAAAEVVTELGGEVTVMDRVAVQTTTRQTLEVDLRERPAIDEALSQLEPVDAVFSAAGVADGTEGIERINFISHRHIIETLVADGRLGRGGAVCMISSASGIGWETNLPQLREFNAIADFDEAVQWIGEHPGTASYTFTKQALNFYVAWRSFSLLRAGIRINAILPGPTDTPLARSNADLWLGFAQGYRDATGTDHLTPRQMAETMAFLNSDAASGISGVSLLVDTGHIASSIAGSYEADQALVQLMLGRS